MADADIASSIVEEYERVVRSYSRGIIRLLAAIVGYRKIQVCVAVLRKHSPTVDKESPKICADCGEPIDSHEADPSPLPSRPQWDAFSYLSDINFLVYATTLLDSFLHDTTLFLLLHIPGSIGGNQTIKVSDLLEARSREELFVHAAKKRAREVGHASFEERIEFLSKTYGLDLHLTESDLEVIRHYSDIRNAAIHDQGIYRVVLGADGKVKAEQKTCERHPTPVDGVEVEQVVLPAYGHIVRAVATKTITQVLKSGVNVGLSETLDAMAKR